MSKYQKLLLISCALLSAISACKKGHQRTSEKIKNPNEPDPKPYISPACQPAVDTITSSVSSKIYKMKTVNRQFGQTRPDGGREFELSRGVEYLKINFKYFFKKVSTEYTIVGDSLFNYDSSHFCNIRGTLQFNVYGGISCRNIGKISQFYNETAHTYKFTLCPTIVDWVAGFTQEKETPLIAFEVEVLE